MIEPHHAAVALPRRNACLRSFHPPSSGNVSHVVHGRCHAQSASPPDCPRPRARITPLPASYPTRSRPTTPAISWPARRNRLKHVTFNVHPRPVILRARASARASPKDIGRGGAASAQAARQGPSAFEEGLTPLGPPQDEGTGSKSSGTSSKTWIPKFASARGDLLMRAWEARDTQQLGDSGAAFRTQLATVPAAKSCELRVRGT